MPNIQSKIRLTESKGKNLWFIYNLLAFFTYHFKKNGIISRLAQFLFLSKSAKIYLRAFHCTDVVYYKDGKLHTNRCTTRVCARCNRVRMAKLINGYAPQLEPYFKAGTAFFVTLTLPTIHRSKLANRLKQFAAWQKKWRLSKPYRRLKTAGIRKLEIHPAFESNIQNVHAHFHFIIVGREAAEALVAHWLAYFKEASPAAQDIRQAKETHVKELFKYMTKPPVGIKGGNSKEAYKTYDAIYTAMYRKRSVQPFGNLKMIKEEIEEEEVLEADGEPGEGSLFIWDIRTGQHYEQTTKEPWIPPSYVTYSKKTRQLFHLMSNAPPIGLNDPYFYQKYKPRVIKIEPRERAKTA